MIDRVRRWMLETTHYPSPTAPGRCNCGQPWRCDRLERYDAARMLNERDRAADARNAPIPDREGRRWGRGSLRSQKGISRREP